MTDDGDRCEHGDACWVESQLDGYTHLHRAILEQEPVCINCLITAGADVNQCDQMARSPLILAIETVSLECVRLLLAHGANPNTISA